MSEKKFKVIVIGAGMAGIRVAASLYESGVSDVLILEARDRLGGRLKSIKSENYSASYDLGASWFHDSLKNPLFDKAVKLGNIEYFYDDGKHVYFSGDDDSIPSWEFDQVVEEFSAYVNLYFSEGRDTQDISLKELCLKYIDEYDHKMNSVQKKYAPAVVRLWAELWHGESWDKLSSKYFFGDMDHLGRNVFVKNGYINVFNNELEELPKNFRDNNILINSHVKVIDYVDPKTICIKTNEGKEYFCDYLVVTVPQSLLSITDSKSPSYIEWSPPLPNEILEVSPYVKFGSLGKVVLEFDHCFWPEDVQRFYFLSTDLGEISFDKDYEFPFIFMNYQVISGVPALVTLIQKPLSEYIETLEPKSKKEKIWKIFAPCIKKMSTNNTIKEPIAIHHTEWSMDPYSYGSYATTVVGTIEPEKVNQGFAKGVSGRIQFAGAETVDGSANGCAHGAWFSAEREAKILLDKIGTEKIKAKY